MWLEDVTMQIILNPQLVGYIEYYLTTYGVYGPWPCPL